MRFALTADQRHHFQKEGKLELAELLTPKQVEEALSCIRPKERSQEEILLSGRDLFRDNPLLSKVTLSRPIAQAAAELLLISPLRFAYSQLLVPTQPKENKRELYPASASLEEVSAFQGIVGGVILCLQTSGHTAEDPFFPTEAGSGLFIPATTPIPFERLAKKSSFARYLLIVYGRKNLVYVKNDGDPHVHGLKKLDYVFGDRVREETHPTLALA